MKGIIISHFGTSHKDTEEKTLEPINKLVENSFSDFDVRYAFTSRIIARILKSRDRIVLNPREQLEAMYKDGIREFFIQPTLIIEGHEKEELHEDVKCFTDKYPDTSVKIGAPLLAEKKDYNRIIEALNIKKLADDEMLVYIGHGTDHQIDRVYKSFEEKLHNLGHENVYIATVEGAYGLEYIEGILKGKDYKKIELRPFMIVAGDHAKNDIASEDGWAGRLKELGYDIEAKLIGLGENENIREIFLEHLKEII